MLQEDANLLDGVGELHENTADELSDVEFLLFEEEKEIDDDHELMVDKDLSDSELTSGSTS